MHLWSVFLATNLPERLRWPLARFLGWVDGLSMAGKPVANDQCKAVVFFRRPTLQPTLVPTPHPTFGPTDAALLDTLTPSLLPSVLPTFHPSTGTTLLCPCQTSVKTRTRSCGCRPPDSRANTHHRRANTESLRVANARTDAAADARSRGQRRIIVSITNMP